jgi:hypothetical protein
VNGYNSCVFTGCGPLTQGDAIEAESGMNYQADLKSDNLIFAPGLVE